jgi:hypothetical protein
MARYLDIWQDSKKDESWPLGTISISVKDLPKPIVTEDGKPIPPEEYRKFGKY